MCQSSAPEELHADQVKLGLEANIAEVECRVLGAPARVWEISKTPKA